MMMFPLRGDP